MNYLKTNRKAWNDKTVVHLQSDFYDQQAFLAGKNSLKNPEQEVLGNVEGKRILHLQCHFGQDTLSLARMGAKVTGLDFSEVAIENAKQINKKLGLDAQFVCSDVCDLPKELYNQFDLVFTSYGTIGWFPDLTSWAETIKKALVPGGKFIMVDFHPFIWAFDNDLKYLQYDYFKSEPIEEEIEGSYADRNASIKTKTLSWNHGIGEILNTLIQSGISIHEFTEMDYSPFDCFSNLKKIEDDKFVFSHIKPAIPMIYRIVGEKRHQINL